MTAAILITWCVVGFLIKIVEPEVEAKHKGWLVFWCGPVVWAFLGIERLMK